MSTEPRGATRPLAAPQGDKALRVHRTPENASRGRTGPPRACGHTTVPSRGYCPDCRAWQYDQRYQARHHGHDVIETAATRRDGRPYRQCLTCAPWREPRPPGPVPADEFAVLRAVQGDRPEHLTRAERRAAIRQLRGALPVPLIAERVGVSERTVWRHLAATPAP